MIIYQNIECNVCGERGNILKVNREGFIYCKGGCYEDGERIVEGLSYQDVGGSGKALQEIVKDLLKKDLNRIYVTNAEMGKDELYKLRGEDGELDPKKVYFQDNDIFLIVDLQRAAYKALTYLETGNKEFRDSAKRIYDYYINARMWKFTEDEEGEIRELLEKEMYLIDREIGQ